MATELYTHATHVPFMAKYVSIDVIYICDIYEFSVINYIEMQIIQEVITLILALR